MTKNTAGISKIKKWFKKFVECDFHLNDLTRSGRPQETKGVDLEELLNEDANQFIRDLGKRMHVNQSTIQRRLKITGKILKISH